MENGKRLTKAQKAKVKRIEYLMKSLLSDGVEPVLLDGSLVFVRDGLTTYVDYMKHGFPNKEQVFTHEIQQIVP